LVNQFFDKSEYEVLVVNDGDDGVTQHIVLSYLLYNIKYLSLPDRQGHAAAKNFGWRHAKARLIAFTEDYSIPNRDWLDTLVESYSDDLVTAFAGRVEVPLPEEPTDNQRRLADLEDASFSTLNCACTKTALEIVGGFDERYASGWRADQDLEFKLIQQGIPIVRIENATMVIPVRESSWTAPIKEQKQGIANALLYKKFPRLYRQKIQQMPKWNYYLMVLAVLSLVVAAYLNSMLIALICLGIYILLYVGVVVGRLMFTSRRRGDVLGVLTTSIFVPFAFVYWHIYGSVKYRVLFL
jgi:glycosyltransferase involved in cell wall biosynthesis